MVTLCTITPLKSTELRESDEMGDRSEVRSIKCSQCEILVMSEKEEDNNRKTFDNQLIAVQSKSQLQYHLCQIVRIPWLHHKSAAQTVPYSLLELISTL